MNKNCCRVGRQVILRRDRARTADITSMLPPIADTALDAILATQLTVAWAGEGRCSPKRLGWWDTDLIDLEGGGEFLRRLLPKTHAWAALEAARESARRTDAKARGKMADPDKLRTLFFLGFELDERLNDRLRFMKGSGREPSDGLPLRVPLVAAFDRNQVSTLLRTEDVPCAIVPGGRQLTGALPQEPEVAIAKLAAALVPFSEQYPLPFFKVEA
jgi:hypothetical protein